MIFFLRLSLGTQPQGSQYANSSNLYKFVEADDEATARTRVTVWCASKGILVDSVRAVLQATEQDSTQYSPDEVILGRDPVDRQAALF